MRVKFLTQGNSNNTKASWAGDRTCNLGYAAPPPHKHMHVCTLDLDSCPQYGVLRCQGSRNSPEPETSWKLHKNYDILSNHPTFWKNDHTHTLKRSQIWQKILVAQVFVPLFCARMSTALEHTNTHFHCLPRTLQPGSPQKASCTPILGAQTFTSLFIMITWTLHW